jgi:aromatic-L-amino-acid decarboxylase
MRDLGYQVTELVTRHLSSLRNEPAIKSLPRSELNRALAHPPPRQGSSFESILHTLDTSVFPYHAREPHPGFLAYIPSCPTFPAVLGDWIASGYNFFAGVWPVAAGPNEIEIVVLEWIREWMGLATGATGLLTTGGSAANLTAVAAARHRAVEAGCDINRLAVYTSQQAHSSVTRAAWIAGIKRENVRVVGMDNDFAILPSDLVAHVTADRDAGRTPFLVVASAGTTNTGTVDPLDAIADYCELENLWLHVDAAYAGFAALTDEGRRMLRGIERAHSLTLDPHKWLFVPFECGCLMVREASLLTDAFRILPEYLRDVEPAEEEVNFADRGEQLTRYSRALKIWISVNYFGTDAITEAIQGGMDRARLVESLVRESDLLEVLSPACFGIVCFRVHPTGMADGAVLDDLNERINSSVVAEGKYLISSTRLRGNFSLRICNLGFRTTEDDIRDLMETIERIARVEIAAIAAR